MIQNACSGEALWGKVVPLEDGKEPQVCAEVSTGYLLAALAHDEADRKKGPHDGIPLNHDRPLREFAGQLGLGHATLNPETLNPKP